MNEGTASHHRKTPFKPYSSEEGDDKAETATPGFSGDGPDTPDRVPGDVTIDPQKFVPQQHLGTFAAQTERGQQSTANPRRGTIHLASEGTIDRRLHEQRITADRLEEIEQSIEKLTKDIDSTSEQVQWTGSIVETHNERIDKLEIAVDDLQKHSQVIEAQRETVSKTADVASLLVGAIGVVVAAGIWFLPLTGVPLGLRAFSILIVLIVTLVIAADGAISIYTLSNRKSA
jgi:archaellum component FlaC